MGLQKICPRWVTGVKNRLADSSAYPKQFGEAVFMAYTCWNVSCHSNLKLLTSNYNIYSSSCELWIFHFLPE